MNDTRFETIKPDNPIGYTWAAIDRIFQHRPKLGAEFRTWMNGQTLALDPRTGEGIVYESDLKSFLMGGTQT